MGESPNCNIEIGRRKMRNIAIWVAIIVSLGLVRNALMTPTLTPAEIMQRANDRANAPSKPSVLNVPYARENDVAAIAESRRYTNSGLGTYIEPLVTANAQTWAKYVDRTRRGQCQDWQKVVEFVDFHYKNGSTDEFNRAAELTEFHETIGDALFAVAMEEAEAKGWWVSKTCQVRVQNSKDQSSGQFVLLNPGPCDLVFSYGDKLVTCLSDIDRQMVGYTYDTLVLGDFSKEGDRAYIGLAPASGRFARFERGVRHDKFN